MGGFLGPAVPVAAAGLITYEFTAEGGYHGSFSIHPTGLDLNLCAGGEGALVYCWEQFGVEPGPFDLYNNGELLGAAQGSLLEFAIGQPWEEDGVIYGGFDCLQIFAIGDGPVSWSLHFFDSTDAYFPEWNLTPDESNELPSFVPGPLDLGSFDTATLFVGSSFALTSIALGAPIPEPSAALIFGLGTLVIGPATRRRKN